MAFEDQFLTPEVQARLDAMGADIRQMRIAADATQRGLEDLAWLDQTSISRIERGLMPRLPLHKYARLRAAVEGQYGPLPRRSRRTHRRAGPDWD